MDTNSREQGTHHDPLSERQQLRKDMSESPSSERETAQKQTDQSAPSDVDESAIRTLPGTGGPDDAGDIEVDDEDVNLPR